MQTTPVTPKHAGTDAGAAIDLKRTLVGGSKPMQAVRLRARRFAEFDPWPVLITGPSGTGKTTVARLIHALGPRRGRKEVEASAAAFVDGMERAELAGHRRGSFTGADRDAPGLMEDAHGSTFILDEIGAASPRFQAYLLRLIETGEVRRFGVRRPLRLNVRFICATKDDLPQRVRDGSFREDLYGRIRVLELRMPGLRERRADIPLFVEHIHGLLERERDVPPVPLSPSEWERVLGYGWPLHVRELENALKFRMATGELPENVWPDEDWKKDIDRKYEENGRNVTGLAKAVGKSRKTVSKYLNERRRKQAATA